MSVDLSITTGTTSQQVMRQELENQVREGMLFTKIVAAPIEVIGYGIGEGIKGFCNSGETAKKICKTVGTGIQKIEQSIPLSVKKSFRQAHANIVRSFEQECGISPEETDDFLGDLSVLAGAKAMTGTIKAVKNVTQSIKKSKVLPSTGKINPDNVLMEVAEEMTHSYEKMGLIHSARVKKPSSSRNVLLEVTTPKASPFTNFVLVEQPEPTLVGFIKPLRVQHEKLAPNIKRTTDVDVAFYSDGTMMAFVHQLDNRSLAGRSLAVIDPSTRPVFPGAPVSKSLLNGHALRLISQLKTIAAKRESKKLVLAFQSLHESEHIPLLMKHYTLLNIIKRGRHFSTYEFEVPLGKTQIRFPFKHSSPTQALLEPNLLDRVDYSKGYYQDASNFKAPPKEFQGIFKRSLNLVQFHGQGMIGTDRSWKWFAPVIQCNELCTIESLMDRFGLLKSWGERTHATLIKIPPGVPVRFLYGRAGKQVNLYPPEYASGGCVQYRFHQFDPKWIVETRALSSQELTGASPSKKILKHEPKTTIVKTGSIGQSKQAIPIPYALGSSASTGFLRSVDQNSKPAPITLDTLPGAINSNKNLRFLDGLQSSRDKTHDKRERKVPVQSKQLSIANEKELIPAFKKQHEAIMREIEDNRKVTQKLMKLVETQETELASLRSSLKNEQEYRRVRSMMSDSMEGLAAAARLFGKQQTSRKIMEGGTAALQLMDSCYTIATGSSFLGSGLGLMSLATPVGPIAGVISAALTIGSFLKKKKKRNDGMEQEREAIFQMMRQLAEQASGIYKEMLERFPELGNQINQGDRDMMQEFLLLEQELREGFKNRVMTAITGIKTELEPLHTVHTKIDTLASTIALLPSPIAMIAPPRLPIVPIETVRDKTVLRAMNSVIDVCEQSIIQVQEQGARLSMQRSELTDGLAKLESTQNSLLNQMEKISALFQAL
jgi:hypothetical protein